MKKITANLAMNIFLYLSPQDSKNSFFQNTKKSHEKVHILRNQCHWRWGRGFPNDCASFISTLKLGVNVITD